jgi:hypothetical protein
MNSLWESVHSRPNKTRATIKYLVVEHIVSISEAYESEDCSTWSFEVTSMEPIGTEVFHYDSLGALNLDYKNLLSKFKE